MKNENPMGGLRIANNAQSMNQKMNNMVIRLSRQNHQDARI